MKILLAVDGSPYTKKMLAYLATHDLYSPHNDYTVFTAQMVLPPQACAVLGEEKVHQYHHEEEQRIMDPVRTFLQHHGINPRCTSGIGRPGALISKLAEDEKFDLVVMGSHGHSALTNLVLGSVTTEVLAHCGVPVLIIR